MKTATFKSRIILVIGIICLALPVIAQNDVVAVLKSSDIDRFIDTYKSMAADFELLSDEMEDEGDWDNMTYESVLRSFESGLANNKGVAIIEKYGWDKSTYGKKMMAITMGSSYLIVLDHIADMPEEQGKAMAEIYKKQYKVLVHEDDLTLLKPRITELEKFFTEE